MRYERKYRIEHASWREVELAIRQLPMSFQTAYPDRRINSIYLDSPDLRALQDNLGGISNRWKFRLRWYGDDLLNLRKPILEKKIKHNQLGTKERFRMPDLTLSKDFELTEFLMGNSPVSQTLRPVVLVQYVRSYFESFDRRVRATIDRELRYFHFQGNIFREDLAKHDQAVILEVKYDQSLDGELDEVFQNLPFRLSKNSKFVEGVLGFYY